ncbi:FG-GAP-like repeat-containing protein [Pseudoxanthomonas mexicana]|uniref:FG-GAP-like repeat-containing protein n=1 Tax=Pseudoxanthomonas mexicana TaxID=128785 RepID=UPI00078669CE|nr:FG-GAP-like repeat-containing protein [Pseudoxanthomonas mexicana]
MRGAASTGTKSGMPLASVPLARAISASIANEPDRGALIRYAGKSKPAKIEGAYSWYPASISEAHALKGVIAGEMNVPAPDGSNVKLRYERHVEETDGNWTWIGRVVGGDQRQEAIITFGEKAVFGSIPQANGKPALSLQTRQGSLWVVQTDPSKVVSATKGHTDIMVPEASALRSSMAAAVSQAAPVAQAATAISQAAPPTSANTIDVAIGYTPEFAAANNGASGAATRLVYLIQVGNQAFANSDINGYLRIVNTVQVSYANTTTNQSALSELTGSNGSSSVTVPASLAPLRTARDQYGADIAVLVRKFNTPENEGCGIAWLNGAGQTAITSADAAWGFAVISDGFDQGSDGKTYYCADETLVHEAAHLMGSAHDRANSTTSTGALQYGRYAYSFGYKTAASAGNFYTIMAYGDTGQTAHRIFSTPLKSTCGTGGNLACGVANSEDNARSLNQTIPVVATFRATLVPFQGGVVNDVNADSRSDIVLRYGTSGGLLGYWLMNGASIGTASSALPAPPSHDVVATGDLNGDGRLDILWSRASDRNLVLWQGNSTGGFDTIGIGGLSAGWTIVGTGDVNADGKSDIILRYGSAGGLMGYWLMNGSAITTASSALPAPPGHDIVARGDFNGDGRLDILWSRASDRNLVLWQGNATNGFDTLGIGGLSVGWTIAGAGDINADGRSDIILRYGSAGGALGYWTMNGATISSASNALPAPPGHDIAAIGDFNGDGRSDIMWTRASDRNLVLWQANSSGGFDTIGVGGLSTGWRIVNP